MDLKGIVAMVPGGRGLRLLAQSGDGLILSTGRRLRFSGYPAYAARARRRQHGFSLARIHDDHFPKIGA